MTTEGELMTSAKEAAGRTAADMVETGTVVGLGTGSTVWFTLVRLAERIRSEGLEVVGVPTSMDTTNKATELDIPLAGLGEVEKIDLTIDGGWNMISIPVEPFDAGINAVLQGANTGVVWGWDGAYIAADTRLYGCPGSFDGCAEIPPDTQPNSRVNTQAVTTGANPLSITGGGPRLHAPVFPAMHSGFSGSGPNGWPDAVYRR